MNHTDKNQYLLTPLEIIEIESVLAKRARELTQSLAKRNQIIVERSADEFDDALLATERESSAQFLSQDLRLLREIEATRDRLRSSTYGVCLHCEEAIAPRRLQAIPWAAYCISCQGRVDDDRACQTKLANAA